MKIVSLLLSFVLSFFNDSPALAESLTTPVLSFVNNFKVLATYKGKELSGQIESWLIQLQEDGTGNVVNAFMLATTELGLNPKALDFSKLVESVSKTLAALPEYQKDALLLKLASITLRNLAQEQEGLALTNADSDTLMQLAYHWAKHNSPELVANPVKEVATTTA